MSFCYKMELFFYRNIEGFASCVRKVYKKISGHNKV